MAVITSLGITFDTNAGNKTVVATPAANDLIVIVCANTGRTTAQDPTISDDNGDGGTWVQIGECTKNTSADTMWAYVRSKPIERVVSTTFTFAPNAGADTGGGLQVFAIAGMEKSGLNAIRQFGKQDNQAGATTPAITFTFPRVVTSPNIGAVFNGTNPATMSAPGAVPESQDVGYITPTTGLETCMVSSGTNTNLLQWGGTSGTAFCSLGIEIDAATPQASAGSIRSREKQPPDWLHRMRPVDNWFGGGNDFVTVPSTTDIYPIRDGGFGPSI